MPIAFILALLMTSWADEPETIILNNEIEVPVLEDWYLEVAIDDYPVTMLHDEPVAELQIFRSEFPEKDAFIDDAKLKENVDEIIKSVILTLPNAKLLTSNGFYQINRTGFILDFVSEDTVALTELRHRLMGVIYRHPEGHQILFTLWAKSESLAWYKMENDIIKIQNDFIYTGPAHSHVFQTPGAGKWTYSLLVIAMIATGFLLFRRRGKYDRVLFSQSDSFWRCPVCHRLNHVRQAKCRRCGEAKNAELTTSS